MPLDNNAKIGDIITALGGMQAINQKAELASVIGAPATASDNVATQITKIQDAKDVFASKIGVPNTTPLKEMADGLVVGGKRASGTITSSSSNLSYSYASGGSVSMPYVEIIGLGFVPRKIELIFSGNDITDFSADGYREDIPLFKIKVGVITASSGSTASMGFALSGNAYVSSNGFKLPVYSANKLYKWYAFE